jgi:hypothetical protein
VLESATDFTRVFTLISMPLVSYRSYVANDGEAIPPRNGLFVFVVLFRLPVVSWSGYDWFLGADLFRVTCKWRGLCRA